MHTSPDEVEEGVEHQVALLAVDDRLRLVEAARLDDDDEDDAEHRRRRRREHEVERRAHAHAPEVSGVHLEDTWRPEVRNDSHTYTMACFCADGRRTDRCLARGLPLFSVV